MFQPIFFAFIFLFFFLFFFAFDFSFNVPWILTRRSMSPVLLDLLVDKSCYNNQLYPTSTNIRFFELWKIIHVVLVCYVRTRLFPNLIQGSFLIPIDVNSYRLLIRFLKKLLLIMKQHNKLKYKFQFKKKTKKNSIMNQNRWNSDNIILRLTAELMQFFLRWQTLIN